jgi:hypothetical protein
VIALLSGAPGSSTRQSRVPTALIVALLVGAAVRLLALAIVPNPNFPDARSYLAAGRELFDSGTMSVHIYMPLYPIWTFVTGGEWTYRLADVGLSTLTIWAIWRAALDMYADRQVANLAAAAAALYPHFIFYSISGLTETAFILLLILTWIAAYRGRWAWAAVTIVLSILVRPAMDILGPLLLALFAVVVRREPFRVLVKIFAIYAAVYVVLMSPWWLHNYEKYDRFVRLNLGDGIVLYSGNNPMNRTGGGVGREPGDTDVDISPFLGIADPYERNEAMKAAAWKHMAENPGRTLELAGLKFVRFWRLWPFSPDYKRPWIVVTSLLSYGVMLALAVIGLILSTRRYWRSLAPPLIFAAYLTTLHMVTIGSIRYRLPIEPFILIVGCYALAQIGQRIGAMHRLLQLIRN